MAVEIPVVIDIEKAFQDAAKNVNKASAPLRKSMEELGQELAEDMELMKMSSINDELFIQTAKDIQRITQTMEIMNDQFLKYSSNEGSLKRMNAELASINRRWEEMGAAQKYAANGALSDEAKQLKEDFRRVTEEIQKTGQTLTQLAAEEERINSLRQKGVKSRQYEDAILKTHIQTVRVLSEQQRILSERLQRTQVGTEQYQKLSVQLQYVSDRLKQLQGSASSAQGAMSSVASSSDKATASINNTNQALQRQSGLWAQLKGLATMYISVFGGLRFMDNIRKTTSELEMQRIALGSIIQDTQRANELFREIKAAALKSPFEIKDLVTFTKQLAAYKIETEDLFKVTTRLADVSAGLGVDMNRLVLAYGQVRAASVLRGQELRQFTEAGIPLVEKLAEKFQELGREGTTTADVFELISKRAVPFSMIEQIFDDMTSAGGEFYKMQEKQSETLKGQWMKLKDAITIMYDEIGNTPQVHKAMEDLIQGALSLTRSWREVSRWIATIGGALVSYAIASRSAAVATNALTYAEALALAKEKERMVMLPKVVAAIIGEEKAKRLSVRATMRLTAAQAALASSTTLVAKAFNAARVAILSNPYAIAAAGIAAVGLGIYTLIKNSQKAKVSIDSLEQSITEYRSSIGKLEDTERLVSRYEELSEKANKTAKEQAELSRVTNELSKAFPSAVEGINSETGALEVNLQKVKDLTRAEIELEETRLRVRGNEARDRIAELEAQRAKILKKKEAGGVYSGQMGAAYFIPWTEKELADMGDQLANIRQELEGLYKTAYEIDELTLTGPLPLTKWTKKGEEAQTTATLSAWKDTITKIQDEKAKAGATKLWSEDDITKFESVLKFSKDLKKKQDELTQSIKTNKELLKTATDDTKANIEADIKADEETLKMVEAIKKALGIIFKSTTTRDTRLSQLKSEISELTNAYKKFEELKKYKSEDQALIDVKKLFPQLGDLTPTLDNIVKELENKLAKVKADLAKSPKSKTLLDMQRALETEISNLRFDELKRSLEDKLKKLSDEIKRSEAARNFYRDIFDLTGDEDLATSLSVSVYGDVGSDFKERLQRQLKETLSDITIDADMRKAIDLQDFETILKKLPEGTEKVREEIIKLRDAQQKFSADQIKAWVNELKKAKTYSDKRVALARQTQERIAEINASALKDEEKKRLTAEYNKREQEEAAKLEYEAFKQSPLYVKMFDNLDAATSQMLTTLRTRIAEMMEQWNEFDPQNLKEMQSRLNEIDQQLAKRNPFKVLADSLKKYQELSEKGRTRQGDLDALAAADKALKTEKEKLEVTIEDVRVIKERIEEAEKEFGAQSDVVTALNDQLEVANDDLDTQKQIVTETEKAANAAAKNADEWEQADKNAQAAVGVIKEMLGPLSIARDIARDFVAAFADDALADTISSITDSLTEMAGAVAKTAAGAAIGDYASILQGIMSYFTSVLGLYYKVGKYFIVDRPLKKWNDQMTAQDKVLQRLDRSYDNLDRAMAKSFGSDYIYNYTEALKNLEAQQAAYNKQLEIQQEQSEKASRKQDRDAAKEAADEAAENIRKTQQAMADLRESMQQAYLGTTLDQAAKDFADSWLEAYRTFGSTTTAIKEKMQDMIDNLVVKSALAGVAQSVLKPFFDQLNAYAEAGTVDDNINELITQLTGLTDNLNTGMTATAQILRAAGINLRGSVGNLTGISRNIASASEESILGLAAGINTQNYYMSAINQNVAAIVAHLTGGVNSGEASSNIAPASTQPEGEEGIAMPSIQKMVYDHLGMIDQNIADIRSMLSSVISRSGAPTTNSISTKV